MNPGLVLHQGSQEQLLLLFFSDVTRIMKGGTGSGLTSIMQSLSHLECVVCDELEMYV